MSSCLHCGKSINQKRKKYCSEECSYSVYRTDEYRLKVSEKRKKYLKENPEKHPWKNESKRISKPCEKVKEYLNLKNINYVEEWQPIENRFFSIDIAFPDIKLGIEVNGNQHYNSDGTLKEYYQKRHDLIEKEGWKLIELHYSLCFDFNLIEKILDIKEQPDYTEYFRIKSEKEFIKKSKIRNPRGQTIKEKTDLKWEEYKSIIINSDIDFSKFGWVTKVSKILKISPQKVNEWMKRYLPDFYEDRCFKRKYTGVSHLPSKQTLIE